MARYVLFAISIVFLTGCASYKLYDGPELDKTEVAVLTSSSDSKVKTLIKEAMGVDEGIRQALIYRINGKEGNGMGFGYNRRVYNGTTMAEFTIQVLPGFIDLDLLPNHYRATNAQPYTVYEKFKAGHEYFIGQVLESNFMSQSYRWQPVIVDKTAQEVIYPVNFPKKP